MPYRIEFHEESKIVEVYYFGEVTSEDISMASTESQAELIEKRTNLLLVNSEDISDTSANIMDVHLLPTKLYSKFDPDKKKVIAIINSKVPSVIKILRDYFNACFNRGWRVERFDHYQNAVEWLSNFLIKKPEENID